MQEPTWAKQEAMSPWNERNPEVKRARSRMTPSQEKVWISKRIDLKSKMGPWMMMPLNTSTKRPRQTNVSSDLTVIWAWALRNGLNSQSTVGWWSGSEASAWKNRSLYASLKKR